jgi:hypothetical protein
MMKLALMRIATVKEAAAEDKLIRVTSLRLQPSNI